ncbi:glucose-dependent insulinotropic receptor-like [Anopheles ziemanni]|uniref:glucose-dependent insulinotropic receptor-like n=1 Tax=Anopheles coustani TaxID=139045 RepID=UPI00265AD517|nr:glucose-dependent insulinotropic receptor-like [Anopheles coustani]XP_058171661.1 glucose-dependent insulinotropic receptor-like [Anopheles ziemanni]
MVKVQVQNYDDYERIRYFYYIRPPQTPVATDWWLDPMATTTESTTTLSAAEETTLLLYDIFIPMLGSVIIILNLIVVVSSVLLLRKGQQPYTTYMFLGNVAVSDLLTGFAVLYGQYAPRELHGEDNCALMIGLIVSTSLVSVYSVGLIAIDRYLYIVYGLQYQRYLNRTRARILIGLTWIIGISIGFLPAFGWRGDTDGGRTCWFIRLAPPALVVLTAVTGILPVVLVIILYGIILQKALRRVNQLKKASRELQGVQTGNLRLFRGGTRSQANLSDTDQGLSEDEQVGRARRCLCLQSRCCTARGRSQSAQRALNANGNSPAAPTITAVSTTTAATATTPATTTSPGTATTNASKSPTKWKAIKVVMFTTGSFVVTWVPYFIASLMYVACDPATNESLCRGLQFAIASPLAILGFANSLLNPIIYAWWHNGFRSSMKKLATKAGRRLRCCSGCCKPSRQGASTATAVGAASSSTTADDSTVNRLSTNGSTEGQRQSSRTTTTVVGSTPVIGRSSSRKGRGSRATARPVSSDQEFSVTDDTDVELPNVVTRL